MQIDQQALQKKYTTFFHQFPQSSFEKNTTICHAGSADDFFFYIESGAVKMVKTSEEGQTLVLHVFYPTACFSLLSLIHHGRHPYDFVTMLPTVVRKVPKEQFTYFLQTNADVLFDYNIRLLKGLQGLLYRIEQAKFIPAYSQVAGLLLYFARHFGEDQKTENQRTITIRITHQEIADWLGLSRENASLQMKKLEREKLIIIEEDGRFIRIIDLSKIEEISETSSLI